MNFEYSQLIESYVCLELLFFFGRIRPIAEYHDSLNLQRKQICIIILANEKTIYKVDIPANRYDLLCMEGLVRAIQTFEGKTPALYSKKSKTENLERIIIEKETAQVRPIVMGAVLRNITFTEGTTFTIEQISILFIRDLFE